MLRTVFVEKEHQTILNFGLTRPVFERTISRSWSARPNHYSTDAVPDFRYLNQIICLTNDTNSWENSAFKSSYTYTKHSYSLEGRNDVKNLIKIQMVLWEIIW